MPKFPARVHPILARNANTAVIIRRGPSKLVCTMLWDRRNDTFKLGQWLKGRIYERRSDLSPDGKHFIYFAMNGKRGGPVKGSWTTISRTPYLMALVLWLWGDCWNGGGLIVPLDASAHVLWGRDEGGQPLHMDGAIQRAVIHSGFAKHVPPLGAIDWAGPIPRAIRFTLGGEEYPLQVFGYAEQRPNREIGPLLLTSDYVQAGWRVEWGPEFMSEKDGYVRTFRVTNRPLEQSHTPSSLGYERKDTLEPLEQSHTYLATIRIKCGEHERVVKRLVTGVDNGEATYNAIRGECSCDPGKVTTLGTDMENGSTRSRVLTGWILPTSRPCGNTSPGKWSEWGRLFLNLLIFNGLRNKSDLISNKCEPISLLNFQSM